MTSRVSVLSGVVLVHLAITGMLLCLLLHTLQPLPLPRGECIETTERGVLPS